MGEKSRREKERQGGGEGNRGRDCCEVVFWNVTGIGNKDGDFWKGLADWNVMCLLETWVEERGWRKVKGKLPKGYNWEVQITKRRNRKGRTMGRMMMGVNRGIEIVEEEKMEMEDLMSKVTKLGEKE